ncbi:MAG: hypothetical protein M1814_003284 [Vezdaea aestivalis]|nr:MAG: hypothetical protein M1814_003284 [Vezdaea aestivalis]
MAAPVSSKNPYDILGNDESDSDQERGPVKTVDKPQSRTAKRNNPDGAPSTPKPGGDRGGRRGGASGVDGGSGDRNAVNLPVRPRGNDDGGRGDRDRGVRRGRGGRGGRGGAYHNKDDRSGRVDTDKSVSQGWGSTTGEGEWQDEKAGEAMAQTEATEATTEPAATGEENAAPEPAEAEVEPEDNTKSYADYVAEQEANKDSSLGLLQARRPNEGKQNKQWAKAKPLEKEENDEYMIGGGQSKSKRERQRKEKTVVDIDQRYVEPSGGRGDRGDRGDRGGRGRGRGERGERGDRGDRGDRGGRGRGGRGEFRGEYRGRGEPRGEYRGRGGRGGGSTGAQVNVQDKDAFPSLGA